MQVFITSIDLQTAAEDLDDRRLNKQITEINQILLSYLNDCCENIGHANHPVTQWYKCQQGFNFLTQYCLNLCAEYKFRFGKHHMGFFTRIGIVTAFNSFFFSSENSTLSHKKPYDRLTSNREFLPAYIKGRKGVDQEISTEGIYQKYRELLIQKWTESDINTTWTKRNVPEWFLGFKSTN